ncbi:ADP-ribosyl cyclase/cyclic ADP-ribose hydrolase isoform X1 [Hydra vulgaris]|uniref:ADP-ribosyl cyclase/cyclic ADP-ribose hydrolase isoform X1 n=1 Tax=Hydra vulgaris TaxID=6087 RepID=UPI000192567D|nr:ADP-ribosyl cyclase/cyclic ADP-ribose hydrolase [Hydra vulgaris]
MQSLQSFTFFLTLSIVCGMNPWEFKGTTPGIKEIILGRCAQFQQINPLNRIPELSMDVDCMKVWKLFSNSFAFKNTCNGELNETNYEPFFNLMSKKPLADRTLFWSKTYEIAHHYTTVQSNLYTLEDTFQGYLVNGLKWCGCKNCKDGIDYNSCNDSCAFSTSGPFWTTASRLLAENAKGTAYVMISGTTGSNVTAYSKTSFFGKIELPTMGKLKKVNRLVVVVVNDLGKTPKEKCGTGTVKELVGDARAAGINNVVCIDQPRDTLFLLCAKFPNAKECASMSTVETIKKDKAQKQKKVHQVKKFQKTG